MSSIEAREVRKGPANGLAQSQKIERGQLKKQLHGVRKSADFGVQGVEMTVQQFAPNKTMAEMNTINFTKDYPISHARKKRARAQSAGGFKACDTLGDQYWIPIRDHKYRISGTVAHPEYDRHAP